MAVEKADLFDGTGHQKLYTVCPTAGQERLNKTKEKQPHVTKNEQSWCENILKYHCT